MTEISHQQQQQIWDKEHTNPYVLPQMDSREASSGVVNFIQWLNEQGLSKPIKGVELGCGKGRNVLWLSWLGIEMTGLDFSPAAITEAQKRLTEGALPNKASFLVHDATQRWPFDDNTFDLAIDCFATTDIETPQGRKFAASEMIRVLQPGGHLLAYLLSPEDEFHHQMLIESPASERNAFLHPTTGKFEKVFDRAEILDLYSPLSLVTERRIEKTTPFFGKQYKCHHYWMIFEK